MPDAGLTVAVLAARREGRLDPLAERAGVTHKALVPIAGRPLLAHVLGALSGVEGLAGVRVVVEPSGKAALAPVVEASRVPASFVASADNIADSVYAAAQGCEGPLIVTTADNVLLTPGAVADVAARLGEGADGVITLTRKESVLAVHPQGQRRFHRFRDGEYSNCNLYGMSPRGQKLAEAFREGGQFAKNPMRLVRAVGPLNLVILRYGLMSLDGTVRRLARRFGIRGAAVVLEDGAHAIDVDNERTYAAAEQLLAARAG